jgi:hypothetical protein
MKVEQCEHEKVIDLSFWETPHTVILPMLDLVMNIWDFKIIWLWGGDGCQLFENAG